ncbi:ATP-grasp domain-containing protein [Oceanobacillus alkalisoli]|uniref:ATP-grasp domain-containing protein n=1 Tax=Oceanobacillus alkalisoli TaxID=2925113 RepID=UPI001F1205A2|nr:ATP-grasp domain-containing protein [Oceanobacillus alkalisoli]MCF3942626.1 ATP-grasp domain-containing protein [Oceanobacillus alkalisoli]
MPPVCSLKKIDGVITAATDYGVLSAAYVAREMNLPGLDYDVAKIIKNKYLVRRNLSENQVDDISQYFEVENLDLIAELRDKINYPVIVKPCDGSGSKGINKVKTYEQLVTACKEAMNVSLVGRALIEDFIVGEEFGVESFVYNGEVHVLGVMGKEMTKPPYYAELGHFIPSGSSMEEKIKSIVIKAIKSLGINFGSVNMDLLVTKNGDVCIIDIGARMGGNLIGTHIIPLSTGIDYPSIIIKAATDSPFEIRERVQVLKSNVVTRILALSPGKVKSLPDFKVIEKECQVKTYHSLEVGDEIKKYQNNLDGCGYIVSVSPSVQNAFKKAMKSKEIIDRGIIRE